jgi:two-component sensor histidine kinase/tetratricopeptide (TPR) repeat protein
MRMLFLLLMCFGACYNLSGQDLNSLKKLEMQRRVIVTARDDTAKVIHLVKLGRLFLESSVNQAPMLDSAMQYGNAGMQLSASLKYKAGTAQSWLLLAAVYTRKQDIKMSDHYANQVIALFGNQKDHPLVADSYMQLGDNISDKEAMSALEIGYYQKAIAIYQRNGKKRQQAATLIKLGNVYLMGGQYQTMITLLNRARTLYEPMHYPEKEMDLEWLYERFESAYLGMDNYTLALKYALQSVRIIEKHKDHDLKAFKIYNNVALLNSLLKRYETQVYFLNKALPIAKKEEQLHNDSTLVAQVLGNMVVSKIAQGKPEEAIAYLNKIGNRYPHNNLGWRHFINKNYLQAYTESRHLEQAAHYYKLVANQTRELDRYHAHQTTNYNAISKYLIATHQLALADQYVKLNDTTCKKNSQADLLARNYLNWYKIDSIRGDFRSALTHFQLSRTISDSLINTDKSLQLANLQMSYQTEKKDEQIKSNAQKIQLLNKQAQYQQVRLLHEKTVREFSLGGLVMLMIVLALIYNRYRLKQRTSKKLQAQQEGINAANASLQKMNDSLQKLLAEKEWLLKEIHHRVKNNLQIVISLLNTQSAYLDNVDALAAIKNSQHRMHAMSLIHQKLYQSENLASIDMSVYIRELIEYLSDGMTGRKKISMRIDVRPVMLDVSQAVPLGLIINEAVSNAIKYAFEVNADGLIAVSLIQKSGDEYELQIRDNGPGLPAGFDVFETNSLGMSLMYGLSQQLEGEFQLDNDGGLTITVSFKVKRLLN